MMRSRFTLEKILAVLKEAEQGAKVADLTQRHGVSTATIYNWKSKHAWLLDLRCSLEDENANLKRLLADRMLDNMALKNRLSTLSKQLASRGLGA